jgi:hypothetical protein
MLQQLQQQQNRANITAWNWYQQLRRSNVYFRNKKDAILDLNDK